MSASRIWSNKVHENANAYSLASTRIILMLCWLVYLWQDNILALRYIDWSLFHHFGIAYIIPENLWRVSHESGLFVFLKYALVAISMWTIIGACRARAALASFSIGITIYLSYTKGFGGHTNHQELTLLYCTYALVFLPCFDAFSLKCENGQLGRQHTSIYQSSMLVLCLIVVVQYVFTGVARTAIGFPTTFQPEVMETWLAQRALRPNPFGFELVNLLVEIPTLRSLIPFLLPLSTVLELLAPIMLFVTYRWALLFILLFAGFHISILLLMNIPFLENIVLFCVFLPLGEIIKRNIDERRSQEKKITLFFDGDCSLCHGFVRFVFRWETTESIFFAPLQGETFTRISSSGFPEILRNADSIIFFDRNTGEFYAYSDGVILTLHSMGGLWNVPAVFLRIIPKQIRDIGYKLVASVRYRIFGNAENACRLPTKNEKERMLP